MRRPTINTGASRPRSQARNKPLIANRSKNVRNKFSAPKNFREIRARDLFRQTNLSRFAKRFWRSVAAAIMVLALFVVSTMFTPLMSVDRINISGNRQIPTAQLLAALKGELGRPLPLMNEAEIAGKLASFTLIESLSTISHPPHVLEVRIQERSPIALVIVGSRAFEYDPAGVNLGLAQTGTNLPTVLLAEDPKTSEKYKQAIAVLLALPVKIFAKVQYIQAQTRDDVKLQLRGYGSQEVIWGDSSQAALKSKVLNILVSKHSRSARLVFDVSSPLAPSVRPR